MVLRIVMADPAGNRTAIVRTPVPANARAAAAAGIMKIADLRAEQVGFETAPRRGGEGRLEMMGGEFCGNAARSYGYLLCSERPEKRTEAGIEISGHTGLLQVTCDPEEGMSFARMPMPERLERSMEGYPLVVSEGITHMILEDLDPAPELVRDLADRYGPVYDAFGMQFLRGDRLVPVVCVAAAGSMVYESSCGSGSLAAAWYLLQKEKTGESRQAVLEFLFREPGGDIQVRLVRDGEGGLTGYMGGKIRLEQEQELDLALPL
ncbi:MAG: hypothetical protein Q4D81_06835 [Eubacteriales bacterium]|nr:hypothetical protein [Eubacteriales bacterium]